MLYFGPLQRNSRLAQAVYKFNLKFHNLSSKLARTHSTNFFDKYEKKGKLYFFSHVFFDTIFLKKNLESFGHIVQHNSSTLVSRPNKQHIFTDSTGYHD